MKRIVLFTKRPAPWRLRRGPELSASASRDARRSSAERRPRRRLRRHRLPTPSGRTCFRTTLNQMVSTALAQQLRPAHRRRACRAGARAARRSPAPISIPFLDAQAGFTGRAASSVGVQHLRSGRHQPEAAYTSLGAALSWELDIWGRLRRLTEAARANYLASEEGRRAVGVSLVSDVMESYFQLLEQDLELEISRKTGNRRERKPDAWWNCGASAAPPPVWTSARRSSCSTRRQRADRRRRARHRADAKICSACCRAACPTRSRAAGSWKRSRMPAQVAAGPAFGAAGAPSRYSRGGAEPGRRQRADRRGARAVFSADCADGICRAGRAAICWTSPPRRRASTPSRHRRCRPIFHAGQIRNQVRLTEAQQREMLIAYQRSIYSAPARSVRRAGRLRPPARAARPAGATGDARWKTRCVSPNFAIAAAWTAICRCSMRSAISSSGQLALAQLRLQERVSVVQIYRALGGGWS